MEQNPILFIDDVRNPPPELADKNVIIARTVDEMLDRFSFPIINDPTFRWEAIYWDHDLSGTDTTYPLALMLAEEAFYGRPVDVGINIIHSANPVGAGNIKSLLERWGYRVQIKPVWWGRL